MAVATAGRIGAAPALAGSRRAEPPIGLVTLTVMLGLSMAIIDTTIVNVALANMAGNLGATIDEIAWVATGYILANVIIMPLNGWLTALLGRRTFYAASLAIFTIASLLCGLAHNVAELVTFRIIQGIGGGALQPTAQAILFESYPPEKRGQAMAIFGLGAMVGPAIGPTLGGWIVDNFNWPLIFYINIPIGILAFFMTLAFIRDPDYIKKPERGADWVGLAAMGIGIASLQYVLERGQREDWFDSATITLLSVLSAATLTFFIVREIRDKHPFVDLRVFRSRSFTGGNIIGIISGFGLYGLNLMLPLFYENVLHFNATQTGFALLPGAAATALSMPLATIIPRKIGARATIVIGLVIFAWGSWWMGSLNQYVGYWDVFWPRAVQGFALGFVFVPLSTSTLSEIDRGDLAGASGIYTLIRQLGGGIGIAVLQLILLRRQDTAQSILSSSITYANPAVAQMLANATNHAQAIAQLNAMVESNATVLAYNYIFRLSAIIFLLSVPTVFLLRPGKPNTASVPVGE
jgi:DHA2 family multidrug resistance protein